ncbi:ATP-binding protein [Microbacterium sp. Kw_RZR3]|uniref:ATP-binding protein n=1 Tax=unclassified Microbacterium TaxID=2609290 RepID=UPI0023DA0F6F|nr:ATP-binding protein [Microbacterium sp. Kw_RZR3]MDF2045401.1 ATP-binding protein [Microbacterium sp. Kw_RZR3]
MACRGSGVRVPSGPPRESLRFGGGFLRSFGLFDHGVRSDRPRAPVRQIRRTSTDPDGFAFGIRIRWRSPVPRTPRSHRGAPSRRVGHERAGHRRREADRDPDAGSLGIRIRSGQRDATDDSGENLDDEDLSRMGTRFWRAGRDSSRAGTGLGLAIVVQLLRAAGGRMELARSPLGGLSARLVWSRS